MIVRYQSSADQLVEPFVFINYGNHFQSVISSLLVVQTATGVITKTIEVFLHKEGNSFGFVMRGR